MPIGLSQTWFRPKYFDQIFSFIDEDIICSCRSSKLSKMLMAKRDRLIQKTRYVEHKLLKATIIISKKKKNIFRKIFISRILHFIILLFLDCQAEKCQNLIFLIVKLLNVDIVSSKENFQSIFISVIIFNFTV